MICSQSNLRSGLEKLETLLLGSFLACLREKIAQILQREGLVPKRDRLLKNASIGNVF